MISGSHSCVSQLLRILEEKEKVRTNCERFKNAALLIRICNLLQLVKEQEKLITKIIEEGEDINKLLEEFTDEKEKLQKARDEDMQKFRVIFKRYSKLRTVQRSIMFSTLYLGRNCAFAARK